MANVEYAPGEEYTPPGLSTKGWKFIVDIPAWEETIMDLPEEDVYPVLVIDRTRKVKKFGLHERYHKKEDTAAATIANNLNSNPLTWGPLGLLFQTRK